jgi:thioredoxin 1
MATRQGSDSRVRTLREMSFDEAIGEDEFILVEFFTDWCGTCTQMEPILESIAVDTDVAVLKVDIETHLETAIEYGGQRSPTFVLFADGRPIKQLSGTQTETALRDLLEEYVG